MQGVEIFLLKHEIELLSVIFSGKEFQMEAPSYIKLFFILFVFGFGKRIKLELPRRLWFKISFLEVNSFFSELGPMLLSVLNIIFAFAISIAYIIQCSHKFIVSFLSNLPPPPL